MSEDRSDETPTPDDESVRQLREELEAEKERIAALEAENAALLAAARTAEATAAKPSTGRRSHRFWVAILLVLATILTPLSIVALFLKNEVGSTDRYVQTIKPLGVEPRHPGVRRRQRVAAALQARRHQEVREDALPKRADPLAGPLTGALRTFVRTAVLKIIETDQFQTLWVDANRLAHSQLVNVLTGDESGTISATKNGAVTSISPR